MVTVFGIEDGEQAMTAFGFRGDQPGGRGEGGARADHLHRLARRIDIGGEQRRGAGGVQARNRQDGRLPFADANGHAASRRCGGYHRLGAENLIPRAAVKYVHGVFCRHVQSLAGGGHTADSNRQDTHHRLFSGPLFGPAARWPFKPCGQVVSMG